MKMTTPARFGPALAALLWAAWGSSPAVSAEWNPVKSHPVSIGPEANRLLVGFKATPENAVILSIKQHSRSQAVSFTQAHTSAADVVSLAQRAGIALAVSRQITPSMHVLFLPRTLYGVDVTTALAQLRADPAVQFAVVDQRRYALQVLPNDPAFGATANVQSGQWYLGAPTPSGQTILVEGVPTSDFSATDAVDAWTITKGSDGIVIADVDSGILFNHPDLLRAGPTSLGSGFGGRLLPGYDFVGQDFNPNSPFNGLGTYLIANDGDGWDPDPSDPGDWVSATDISNPNDLFTGDTAESSSWHGTRVVGVFGAITNNSTGVAGMTWNSWILPVRALGKGGGYDSDILAGIQWAAGLTVTNPNGSAVPKNPYPADIINLSLGGGTDACSSSNGMAYQTALTQITQMGILVVIAAGNASGPVELPANCAGTVPGVMAVAGLRNVGTKVGYSSFGAQVSVSAPAGNCVNSAGDCLRSIDTATNLGTTVPGINSYTNESNPNLGTSFATPIVSGIAALMLAVNNNLTPVQLAARLESSASPFPPNTGTGSIPVCPTLANDGSQQCACPASGQCGAGMVNAYHAVQAALEPIAAVTIAGNTLNASGSAASCGRVIQTYAWQATGPTLSGTTGSQITWSGSGTIILTVTDDHGGTDSATITVTSNSGTSAGPKSAGTAACPTVIEPNPTPPTISAAFSPASVAPNANAMLTITLSNPNAFALTQSGITETLPANLTLLTMPAPATTCTGASMSLAGATSSVTLANAIIPASGSCQITLSVNSATAANYTNMLGVNALMTGPAGGNSVASSAALAVAAPTASGGGKSGGGAFDVWDLMLVGGVLLAGRRGAKRYNRKDERSR